MTTNPRNYSYTISMTVDEAKFRDACRIIDSHYPGFKKDPILTDVDGSELQRFRKGDTIIEVNNDCEVYALYIDSDIDLSEHFSDLRCQ